MGILRAGTLYHATMGCLISVKERAGASADARHTDTFAGALVRGHPPCSVFQVFIMYAGGVRAD